MLEILDPELYKRFGEVQVVNASELQDMTSRGWQLICLMQEKQCDVTQREVKCPGGAAGGNCPHGYSNSSCYAVDFVAVPHEIEVTTFLLGRDKDTTLGNMSRKLEELRCQLFSLGNAKGKVQSELDDAIKERDKHGEDCARAHEIEEQLRATAVERDRRIHDHLETITKMEGDIGKLRDEFGGRELDRILKPRDDTAK